jgi:hypothetical protein
VSVGHPVHFDIAEYDVHGREDDIGIGLERRRDTIQEGNRE